MPSTCKRQGVTGFCIFTEEVQIRGIIEKGMKSIGIIIFFLKAVEGKWQDLWDLEAERSGMMGDGIRGWNTGG